MKRAHANNFIVGMCDDAFYLLELSLIKRGCQLSDEDLIGHVPVRMRERPLAQSGALWHYLVWSRERVVHHGDELHPDAAC